MNTRKRQAARGVMLELWRPPANAGDPVGCLATTYTFDPGLFDEQCLARFMEIESEPDREDLAFLLERESRLGSVYAGVLVDHTQAGVQHSLRWDVLPVAGSSREAARQAALIHERPRVRETDVRTMLAERKSVAESVTWRPRDTPRSSTA